MATSRPRSPPSENLAETTRTNQASQNGDGKKVTYQTKEIKYGDENKLIILQNEIGSSPLIAICNFLILRNNMDLNLHGSEVTQQRLIDLLGFILFTIEDEGEHFENKRQKITNAMDLLPRLADGISVNIKFRSIDDFELTPELAIFGLLKIPLYHGWIFDPQDYETSTAIGCKSYNDLMTGLVTLAETQTVKSPIGQGCGEFSDDFTAALRTPTTPTSAEHSRLGRGDIQEEKDLMQSLQSLQLTKRKILDSDISSRVSSRDSSGGGTSSSGDSDSLVDSVDTITPVKGEVIKNFLNTNASQVTLPGLLSLREGLKEGDLCVFFRNNHFYTMMKKDNALHTLVTDQGCKRDLVWKNLNQEYIHNIIGSSSKEGTEIDLDLESVIYFQELEKLYSRYRK